MYGNQQAASNGQPLATGLVILVVCNGCARYLKKDGTTGDRKFNLTNPHSTLNQMADHEKDSLVTFRTVNDADVFLKRFGWKTTGEANAYLLPETWCPECTAPKTSTANSRATNDGGNTN